MHRRLCVPVQAAYISSDYGYGRTHKIASLGFIEQWWASVDWHLGVRAELRSVSGPDLEDARPEAGLTEPSPRRGTPPPPPPDAMPPQTPPLAWPMLFSCIPRARDLVRKT